MASKPFWSRHGGLVLLSFVAVLIFIFSTPTFSSHFQFGTFLWERNFDDSVTLTTTEAWRWSYSYKPTTLTASTTLLDSSGNYRVANVGDITFGKATTAGAASGSSAKTALMLTILSKNVDPTFSGTEFWWFGQNILTFSDLSIYSGKDANYYTYVSICCRLNDVLGGNGGKTAGHSGWITPSQKRYSLMLRSFPRIFIWLGYNIDEYYEVTAINRENSAGSSYPGTSSLSQVAPENKLKIPDKNSGVYNWVPSTPPGSTGYGLWAFNTEVQDTEVTTGKHAIQLDFLWVVTKPCLPTDTNCNHPPIWVRQLTHEVIATIPYTYTFTVRDQDKEAITIEHDPVPAFMYVSVSHQDKTVYTSSYSQASIEVSYDVEVDGPAGSSICLAAVDARYLTSLGLFCPKFFVIKPAFMFLTGTLRVFKQTDRSFAQNNFLDGVNQPWPTNASIKPQLNSETRKIELATESGALTTDLFNSWWSDTAESSTSRLHTITMVNYPTLHNAYDMYDPKKAKRVYNIIRPWWWITGGNAPDQYFTYELHTKFDLLDSEEGADLLRFSVTGGELFVFMNSVLVLELKDNTVPMTSRNVAELTTRTVGLSASAIRQKVGAYTGDGTKADSYNIDIFYTHRSLVNSGFQLQFANSTACSAISVLKDPTYKSLLKSAVIFDQVPTLPSPLDPESTNTLWNSGLYRFGSSVSYGTTDGLVLLTESAKSTSGTIWYKDRLKILSGFEITFSFEMTSQSNGLVFVIQDHSPTARGADNTGLGYSGLSRTIAIEFDSMPDTSSVDAGYAYQHISVHKPLASSGLVSASEISDSWPTGSPPVGNIPGLPFQFNNSTMTFTEGIGLSNVGKAGRHDIRIELSPADNLYWLYIYVNSNVRPLYTASFPSTSMESWFADGAFVGFTSSNTSTRAGNIIITRWKTTIIPALAIQSYPGPENAPHAIYNGVAGQNLEVIVQLRDACGAPLRVKGESTRFFGKFVNSYSNNPSSPIATLNDPNAVYDELYPTVVDVEKSPGQYRFSTPVKRSGPYQLYMYLQEADQIWSSVTNAGTQQPGQPLGLAKLTTMNDLYKTAHFHNGLVAPGTESPSQSYFFYDELAPGLDNTRNTTIFDNTNVAGIVCLRTLAGATLARDNRGALLKGDAFTTKAQYDAFMLPIVDEAPGTISRICLLRGDVAANAELASVVDSVYSNRSASAADPESSNYYDNAVSLSKTKLSATWIIIDGKTNNFQSSNLTPVHSRYEFRSGAVGQYSYVYFYISSTHPARDPAGKGLGMILLRPKEMTYDIFSKAQFYMYAKDMYNNDVFTAYNPLAYSFAPQITSLQDPQIIKSTEPFFVFPFTTQNSGDFDMSLYSNSIQVGVSGKLIVNSGPAHYTTSEQSGISMGGEVDSRMSFNVLLRDINGNKVLSQSQTRIGIYRVDWIPTALVDDATKTPAEHTSVFSYTSSEVFPAMWDSLQRIYTIKYTPDFAGTFYVRIYINPPVESQATAEALLEYEMLSSKTHVVAIVAGPAHAHSTLIESTTVSDGTIQPSTKTDNNGTYNFPKGLYTAGSMVYYTVATKDHYGNPRFAQLDEDKELRIYFFSSQEAGGAEYTSAQVEELVVVETNSLYYTIGTNYIKFINASGGEYESRFVFKKVGNIQVEVRLVPKTGSGAVISASTKAGPNGSGTTKTVKIETLEEFTLRQITARWSATITPGTFSSKSELTFYCLDNDQYSAPRVLCPAGNTGSVIGYAVSLENIPTEQAALASYQGTVQFKLLPKDIYSNIIPTLTVADINPVVAVGAQQSIGMKVQYESTASSERFAMGQKYTLYKSTPDGPVPTDEAALIEYSSFTGTLSVDVAASFSYTFNALEDGDLSLAISGPTRFTSLPSQTDMQTTSITWPSVVGTGVGANDGTTFDLIDLDTFTNQRTTAASYIAGVPATNMVVFYCLDGSRECFYSVGDYSCAVSTDGRPMYGCPLKVPDSHQAQQAQLVVHIDGNGCTPPSTGSSPFTFDLSVTKTKCYSSSPVRFEASSVSNAFISFIRLRESAASPITQSRLVTLTTLSSTDGHLTLPSEGYTFGLSQDDTTGADKNTKGIRAGNIAYLFAFEGLRNDELFGYTSGAPDRFVSISPANQQSKIPSHQTQWVACDATNTQTIAVLKTGLGLASNSEVTDILQGICTGNFANKMLAVFKFSTTELLTPDNSKFKLGLTSPSQVHGSGSAAKYYSIQIRPADYSSERSLSTRFTTLPQYVAGQDWTIVFYPLDVYGNQIASADLFRYLPDDKILPYSAIIDATNGATTTNSLTKCTYADYSTVPNGTPRTGTITCTIPGAFYSKIGIKQYRLFAGITVPNGGSATDSNSIVTNAPVISNSPSQAVILPNIIDLSRSTFSLLPISYNWHFTFAPTTNTPFKLYLQAFDQYANPTTFDAALQGSDITSQAAAVANSIVLTLANEPETQFTQAATLKAYNGATWTLETNYSNNNRKVYSLSVVINQPSRRGYKFSATSSLGALYKSYPPQSSTPILYAYSGDPYDNSAEAGYWTVQPPSDTPATPVTPPTLSNPPSDAELQAYARFYTALYPANAASDAKPLTTTDLENFDIEAKFHYQLRIYDLHNSPLVRTLGTDSLTLKEGDKSTLSVKISGPRSFSVDFSSIKLAQDANIGQYGFFEVREVITNSFSIIGEYTVEIAMSKRGGGSILLVRYKFIIGPGAPWIPNTVVNIDPFTTNQPGNARFKFYDRLSNLIKEKMIDSVDTPVNSFSALKGQVALTLHTGSPSCGDIHTQTDFSKLSYALPFTTPQANPNLLINSLTFDDVSGEYLLNFKVSPRNTYSLNMTVVGANRNQPLLTLPGTTIPYFTPPYTTPGAYPGSVGECNQVLSWGVRVGSGVPVASTSSWVFSPDVGVGTAGARYTIDVYLRDVDGTATDGSNAVSFFYNPDNASDVYSSNDLYYLPGSSSNNIIDVVQTDLTSTMGRGHVRFTFTPIRVGKDWVVKIYLKQNDGSFHLITGGPSRDRFTVNHGAPASVVFTTLPKPSDSLVAGTTVPVQISAQDQWGNAITTNTMHGFEITITRTSSTMKIPVFPIESLRWTLDSNLLATDSNGITTIPFDPSWEGEYTIGIILRAANGSFITETSIPDDILQVEHSTCLGSLLKSKSTIDNLATATKYRCASDQSCVAEYTQCTNPLDQAPVPVGKTIISVTDPENPSLPPTLKVVSLTDPVSEGGLGYTLCTNGSYVSSPEKCPSVTPCPTGLVQCTTDKTQCRASQDSCPSPLAAPPGFIVCPNGRNIAKVFTDCPTLPSDVYATCQSKNGVVCGDGSCRASSFECPSAKTCPQKGWVLCLSDYTCKPSASQCLSLPEGQLMTPAKCQAEFNSPTATSCWNNQCASSPLNCASQITCPLGQVLCGADSTCKKTVGECYLPLDQAPSVDAKGNIINPLLPALPSATSITCSFTEVTCFDGSCSQNAALCASLPTCEKANPILCPDRRCVSTLSLCSPPSTIPTGYISCPSSGLLVLTPDKCPIGKQCPPEAPILSSSRECVADLAKATPLPTCTPAAPFVCPFTNSCRRNVSECPTPLTCPSNLPFVCPDGSCNLTSDLCRKAKASTGTGGSTGGTGSTFYPDSPTYTNSITACPSSLYQCATGECTASPTTCPTYVTCPLGSSRCIDGTCRASCKGITASSSCALEGLITCPNPSTGLSTCARKISECPQGITCPAQRPIKCSDASCAGDLSSCPTVTTSSPPPEKLPCFDGSWAFSCATPVSCPPSAPIKCADQSCKSTLNQCPIFTPCDQESKNKYRCTSNLCVESPFDCTPPVDISICSLSAPIKCPAYQGAADCVANFDDCPSVKAFNKEQAEEAAWNSPTANHIPLTFNKNYFTSQCPSGYTNCRDGSCAVSALSCPAIIPPTSFPYLCPDGGFALDVTKCDSPSSGCPWDRPIRCLGVGSCVARLADCPAHKCKVADKQVPCPDGSCASVDPSFWTATTTSSQISMFSSQFCTRQSNGCLKDQFRCYDGSCVPRIADCTSPANINWVNSCPPGAPAKCSNGLCVEKLSYCPQTSAAKCTDPKNPVPCVDECRQSTELCRLVKPCQLGEERCDDGKCRDTSVSPCPAFNSCPKGEIRCKQKDFPFTKIMDGMCAPPGQCIAMNGCFIRDSGSSAYRCPNNGLCVSDASLCTKFTLPPANGCSLTSPHRCWNGECTADADSCPLANGCTKTEPFRCSNGICHPTPDDCPVDPSTNQPLTCTKITCADGSCVDKASQCKTKFGCPIDLPVRCGDGSCKRYDSSYRNPKYGLTAYEIMQYTCPLTISCPNDSYTLCMNGKCVENTKECAGVRSTSCREDEFQCFFDGSCRPSPQECGKSLVTDPLTGDPVLDVNGNQQWQPTVYRPDDPNIVVTSCPASVPVTCPNGSCVASISDCNSSFDVSKNIIIGSSTSSQRDLAQEFQVVCFDGTYRASYQECRDFAQKLEQERCEAEGDCDDDDVDDGSGSGTGGGSTTPKKNSKRCIDYCANGQCILKQGQTCPSIASCNPGSYRCWDGSCRSTPCPDTTPPTCADKVNKDGTKTPQFLCLDGACRSTCPSFDGCSSSPNERYTCLSRNCAPSPDLCEAASHRDGDAYALIMLADSEWYEKQPNKIGLLPSPNQFGDFYTQIPRFPAQSVSLDQLWHSYLQYKTETEIVPIQQKHVARMMKEQITTGDVPTGYIPENPITGGGGDNDTGSEIPKGLGLQETPDTKGLSCKYNCLGDDKLLSTAIRYNPLESSQEYLVGPVTSQFSVQLYSGLQVDTTLDTHIYIEPVPSNTVFNATNRVTYSRVAEFGTALTSAQSVLSPLFSCTTGAGLIEPFGVPIRLSSIMDRSIEPLPDPKDICLARLRRFPHFNYANWDCIFTDAQREQGGIYSIRPSDSTTSSGTDSTLSASVQPTRQAVSFITHCYDPDLSTLKQTDPETAALVLELLQTDSGSNTTDLDKIPAVYAFIHQPLAAGQVVVNPGPDWFQRNIILVIILCVIAVLLLFMFFWACARLSRYRKKIKGVKEEVQRMEEAIADIEYGTDDDHMKWQDQDNEISVSRNPLAQQTEDFDETTTEAREQKIEKQRRMSAHRQSVIQQMEDENDQAMGQLKLLGRRSNADEAAIIEKLELEVENGKVRRRRSIAGGAPPVLTAGGSVPPPPPSNITNGPDVPDVVMLTSPRDRNQRKGAAPPPPPDLNTMASLPPPPPSLNDMSSVPPPPPDLNFQVTLPPAPIDRTKQTHEDPDWSRFATVQEFGEELEGLDEEFRDAVEDGESQFVVVSNADNDTHATVAKRLGNKKSPFLNLNALPQLDEDEEPNARDFSKYIASPSQSTSPVLSPVTTPTNKPKLDLFGLPPDLNAAPSMPPPAPFTRSLGSPAPGLESMISMPPPGGQLSPMTPPPAARSINPPPPRSGAAPALLQQDSMAPVRKPMRQDLKESAPITQHSQSNFHSVSNNAPDSAVFAPTATKSRPNPNSTPQAPQPRTLKPPPARTLPSTSNDDDDDDADRPPGPGH